MTAKTPFSQLKIVKLNGPTGLLLLFLLLPIVLLAIALSVVFVAASFVLPRRKRELSGKPESSAHTLNSAVETVSKPSTIEAEYRVVSS